MPSTAFAFGYPDAMPLIQVRWIFMQALSSIDIQKLNQGIQQLHGLNNAATFGVDALTIVHQLVPSDLPTLNRTYLRTFESEDIFLPNFFSGMTVELKKAKTRFLHEHPIAQNMAVAIQAACTVSDFASVEELHALNIYQQFLRPLRTEDQMMLFLPDDRSEAVQQVPPPDPALAGFILNRSERSFTEHDRLIMNLLRPHLIQAYHNSQKYTRISQDLTQLQRSVNHLGLVKLNRDGKVQWATAQALTWLETYFPKPTCTGYLPDDLQLWVQGYRQGATNAPLHVERACEKLVIQLTIDPGSDYYTLLIEAHRRSNLQSLETLGLSQRETEVLGWLMQGKDNRAIATHMDVSASTIRKHLENIYRKFGVQSRTEAVSAALVQLGLL
jgi:DNA-binding CsgD family transcriptional regulator